MNVLECATATPVSFGSISVDEAKECIRKWHYARYLGRGQQYYGAYLGMRLISCAVFDDSNATHPRETEFMAHGRDPEIPQKAFQVSQLLSYCCKQLKTDFDLIRTYCETARGIGSVFKGSSWYYSGIDGPYHLYWKALSPSGVNLACQIGLTRLKYPT